MAYMRSKVYLIKGTAKIAARTTVATYERINADYVALITALRYPATLPDEYSGFEADPTSMYTCINKIMDHWRQQQHDHLVVAEYANAIVDLHKHDVRVVEGMSLKADWFYNTVKSFHRHAGQVVVDCEVLYNRGDNIWVRIEDREWKVDEAIERLKSAHTLG
jgi:hypothetical protein